MDSGVANQYTKELGYLRQMHGQPGDMSIVTYCIKCTWPLLHKMSWYLLHLRYWP